MSTIKADTLSTLDGTKSITTDRVTQGTARAWVNFNGTGTVAIRANYNVSSITDNGAGNYTVNFTTAMPDVNYAFVASGKPTDDDALGGNATTLTQYNQLTTAVSFRANDAGTGRDTVNNGVTIFR